MVKEFVEKASVLLGIRTTIKTGDCVEAEPLRVSRRVTTLDTVAAFVNERPERAAYVRVFYAGHEISALCEVGSRLYRLTALVGLRELVLPGTVYGGVRVEVEVMA